nr:hypothetical protein [uncultured Sphingobacterium sp.]
MGYDISKLPVYSDAQSREFIEKTVFGAQTIDFLEKAGSYHPEAQVGSTDIQLLDTDVVWQNGASCSIAELGSASFEKQALVVKQIAQNMSLCNAELENVYASADLNAKRAGLSLDDALFLDSIMNNISLQNSAKLEQVIWNGDVTKTADATLKHFDGILKQLATGTFALGTITGENIVEKLQNAYLAMPTAVTSQLDFTIFISSSDYAKYKIAVQRANLFDAGNPLELVGTTAKFTIVDGLNGKDKVVYGRARNFRVGGNLKDMAIKNHYSQDDDNVKIRMRLSAGVTILYKQEIGVLNLGA